MIHDAENFVRLVATIDRARLLARGGGFGEARPPGLIHMHRIQLPWEHETSALCYCRPLIIFPDDLRSSVTLARLILAEAEH